MPQVIQNNAVIDPREAQSSSVYRLRLGRLKFFNNNTQLLASSDKGFGVGSGYRTSPLTIQAAGYGKWNFNNNVFTADDLANNTLLGIQSGDVIEVTSTGSTPTTYRYFVRLGDGQLADQRDGGTRIRIFVDRNSQVVIDNTIPMPATIADGTEFDVNIRRWDAPVDNNQVQVWTNRDGYIDASFIDADGLGVEEILTETEKNNIDTATAGAQKNVQADYDETDDTQDGFMRNKPIEDGLNFIFQYIQQGNTFTNEANKWHTIPNSNIPFIDTEDGGFNATDPRRINIGNYKAMDELDSTMPDEETRERTKLEALTLEPFESEWEEGNPYVVGNVVIYQNLLYSCITATSGTTPPPNEPTVWLQITKDTRIQWVNGYNTTDGLFRFANPKNMMFISWGQYGDLTPVSLFEWALLVPANGRRNG